MEDKRREPFFERNDWKIWVALSLLFLFIGVEGVRMGGSTYAGEEAVQFETITGTTWEKLQADSPGVARLIDSQARSGGVTVAGGALFSLALAVFGLRRRVRWAWLTMWVWPLLLAVMAIMALLTEDAPGSEGIPPNVIAQAVIFIITVALLALSYRKYRRS
jgi:cytochrome bd-type quinol oxidase subunit 2